LVKEIKYYFNSNKSCHVRRQIIPGNSSSLWNAVKVSKDFNIENLPEKMYFNNTEIATRKLPDRIAKYIDDKIKSLLEVVEVDENVYNGREMLGAREKFFMDPDSVKECIN
jgi:hypothetical protein